MAQMRWSDDFSLCVPFGYAFLRRVIGNGLHSKEVQEDIYRTLAPLKRLDVLLCVIISNECVQC